MPRTKEVEVSDGKIITVRELTVGEVRAWMRDMEDAAKSEERRQDMVGLLLIEDCTLPDLRRMATISDETMDALSQSDLRKIVEAAKELNPDFFGLRGRIMDLGQRMLRGQVSSSGPSAR